MCEGLHRPASPIRFPSLLALLITVSHPLTVNDSNVYFSVTRTEHSLEKSQEKLDESATGAVMIDHMSDKLRYSTVRHRDDAATTGPAQVFAASRNGLVNCNTVRTCFLKQIINHDPEEYAHESDSQAFAQFVIREKFTNTSCPLGHKFRPWMLNKVHRDMEAGKRAEYLVDGDSSR